MQLALASTWKSSLSTTWSNKTGWSSGTVPTAQDDVTIAVTGSAYTVTNSGTGVANSIALSSANALLNDTGTLTLGASLAARGNLRSRRAPFN